MIDKVLITGATGFIGSHLAELLSKRGDRVCCLVRKTSNLQWLSPLNVEFCYGEVTDKDSLREAARDKDVVYHLASLTKAVKPEDYYRVNAEGTRNLLEACAEENPGLKRFLLVSSLAAAGPSPSEKPIDETWPPQPITDYGKSKLQAEKTATEFRDKIPVTIIRPPAVYGPRDKDVFEYFKMIRKGWFIKVGSRDQLLSFVYAPDLVKSMVTLAHSENSIGKTYFVCNPQPYTWTELSNAIIRAFRKKQTRNLTVPIWLVNIIAHIAEFTARLRGKPALLNRQKMLEVRQPYWVCSASRLEQDTGFTCSTSIEKGISETADWYLKNKWLK